MSINYLQVVFVCAIAISCSGMWSIADNNSSNKKGKGLTDVSLINHSYFARDTYHIYKIYMSVYIAKLFSRLLTITQIL